MDDPSAPSSSTSVSEPLRSSPQHTAAQQLLSPIDAEKAVPNGKTPANANRDPEINKDKTPAGKTAFGLSRSDQVMVAALATVLLALLILHWARLTRWGTVAVEVERLKNRQFEYRLDINSATWVEWGQLEGIGDALARRIVADRDANGPFASVDDLRRVKGIGVKTLEKIRPWLTVDSEVTAQNDPAPARSKRRALTGR
jgi:competence protein ComEA